MLTFFQYCAESKFTSVEYGGMLIQRGDENPNKLPYFHDTKLIRDEHWAQMYRKRYNVAQRKFAAANPKYRIKRGTRVFEGTATWNGRVFHESESEPIGTFSFSVYHQSDYPKLVAEISWLGLYADGVDYQGKRNVDWQHEQVNHRGVMTAIVKLFMEQVSDDISCVVLDDGSAGYWKHFFQKNYPKLTVFDI